MPQVRMTIWLPSEQRYGAGSEPGWMLYRECKMPYRECKLEEEWHEFFKW